MTIKNSNLHGLCKHLHGLALQYHFSINLYILQSFANSCQIVHRYKINYFDLGDHNRLFKPFLRAPYRPIFLEQVDLNAGEAGIQICPEGRITLLPSASGYVGVNCQIIQKRSGNLRPL
ncbi:hypothetical protein [Desulfosporosinus sp. I2]|uniref:hypothetical protein n=1 Tax=Desulfosporosinus sp. I2 TaxID=1617025 RepID=UPI0009E40684|nr:hypothetical protein [Desulfosporosinus sp. I2]